MCHKTPHNIGKLEMLIRRRRENCVITRECTGKAGYLAGVQLLLSGHIFVLF